MIVSYRLSTSNHNADRMVSKKHAIVSYRLSTSNHNRPEPYVRRPELYLIVFLHQTTTFILPSFFLRYCILSSFYIKPQIKVACSEQYHYCILSSFYIKPQRNAYKHLIIKHLKRYSITKSEMMSSFLLQIY